MNLVDIYNQLKAAVKDDELDFFSTLLEIGLPLITKQLSGSLDQRALVVAGVEVSMPDANTVLVKGNTDVFDTGNLDVVLTIIYQNKILQTNLTGSFTGERLALPGVNWINFSKPSISLTVANDTSSPFGKFGGNVNTGVNFDIFVSYPVSANTWLFQVEFTKQYNLSNFLSLAGGEDIVSQLPSPLNAFADLAPQKIDLAYNTKTQSVDYVAIKVGTSPDNVWEILPGLQMKDLLIKCLVQNPGDATNRITIFTIDGTFLIGKGDDIGTFVTEVQVPKLAATVVLEDGKVALGDLLTIFWSDVTIDLKSYISVFNLSIETATQNFLLNTRIDTDWTFITFGTTSLTMTGLTLDINYTNGTTLGSILGTFQIGSETDNIDLNISAAYPATEQGWVFKAVTDGSIDIGEIISTFFSDIGVPLPKWVATPGGVPLIVKDIDFTANVPPSDGTLKNSYEVKGTASWGIKYESFEALVSATSDIVYAYDEKTVKMVTSGQILGDIDFLGLKFQIGYIFGTSGDKELYVQWNGLKGSYSETTTEKVFKLSIVDQTLGGLITDFMQPIQKSFSLGAPWNVLNEIDLNGLDFKYTTSKADGSTKMELSWPLNLDLGFLTLKNITLTKDSTGVFLGFEGSFLGMTIEAGNPDTEQLAGKGSDVTKMPESPGLGSQFFDLQYLGLGQHVALYPTKNLNSVEEATNALINVFGDPPPPVGGKEVFPIGPKPSTPGKSVLIFNEESNWLIGTKFTVVKAIDISIIFNDPNLYGLLISVSDKFQYFKGLKFEILYKKINDSIGVYQMELTLPDYLRQLEFGAVSITLPVIGVQIYTNGNFKIDLGFPESITNFSRSFTVQAFPFIGQGGFYFASLTGVTSNKVPATSQGQFNPVIEFGIGLSLGLGKTIEKGILKAGLTVTFIGIVEGVIAKYNAYPQSSQQSLLGDGEHYYWLQGTFGLVGKLFGEINFAIISARLDITVYAYIRVTIEAYKAIPVYLEAGVSVKLSVKVNLGLFKITIKLGFTATISENFTIGQDTTHQAPWFPAAHPALMARMMALPSYDTIKWQPLLVEEADKLSLNLYYMPHLTVSGESGTQSGKYVNTLYIDSPHATADGTTSLEHLARGVLAWSINSLLNANETETKYSDLLKQTVSVEDIKTLFCYLSTRKDNMPAFNFSNASNNDIEHFLSNLFSINIVDPDHANLTGGELSAGVMPMLPLLSLLTELNDAYIDNVDFATKNMTGNDGYLKAIQQLFAKMSVNYENDLTSAYYSSDDCANINDPDYEDQQNLSVASFLFKDFITLIAKSTLQNAQDLLSKKGSLSVAEVLDQVNTWVNINNLNGQSSRYLLHGIRLPEPPNALAGGDHPLYELSGQQVTIPSALKAGDKYSLSLKTTRSDGWITLNGTSGGAASVTLDDSEIKRIIDTVGISIAPQLEAGSPESMPLYTDALQAFTFKSDIEWQYPGDLFPVADVDADPVNPTIWKLPDTMLDALSSYTGGNNLDLDVQTMRRDADAGVIKTPVDNYLWSTFMDVTVQQISSTDRTTSSFENAVDVIGADEAGIVFLEKLMSYVNVHGDDFIQQIQFLYAPEKTAKNPNGLLSAENGDLVSALVQANLSTETNPVMVASMFARMKAEAETEAPNVLNGFKEFIRLMWQCSIVRTGGYYLYYVTKEKQETLPAYLFNDDTTVKIYMSITYKEFVNEDFINSLIIGDKIVASTTSLFAQSESLTQRVANLPSGVLGFEIDRDYPGQYTPPVAGADGIVPPPSIAEDKIYLENQFNLLGYQLQDIETSRNIMPIGATDDLGEDDIKAVKNNTYEAAEGGPWKYTGVIPFHKFVASSLPATPGLPAPENDPYAGIGETAKIQLNWQDMFGNEIGTPIDSELLSPVNQYTDPIIGLSLWPAITSEYEFTLNGNSPELTINLLFDINRYKADPDTPANEEAILQKAQGDLLTYTTLYYQLGHSADLDIYFQSSIDGSVAEAEGSKKVVDEPKLFTYVQSIIQFVNAVIAGQGKFPTAPTVITAYPITASIDPTKIADYTDIFELTVDFTMFRKLNVADDFKGTGVEISTTSIKPPTVKDSSKQAAPAVPGASEIEEQPISLTEFATLFEEAFANQPATGITLKAATGVSRTDKKEEKDKKIWVVRFDTNNEKGINYTFNNDSPYFFSPIPLETSLKSYQSVDIFEYVTGQDFPANPTPQLQNFNGVDLDAWGKIFLTAVDEFLNAKYAVPAYLLDNGLTLKQVLDHKQLIAKAIEGTMDYIIEPPNRGNALIDNAQEKFKQSILIKLANTYAIDTVVQTPMTVYSSFEGDNNDPPQNRPFVPRLYGKMIGLEPQSGTPDATSNAYSLSNAKVPVGVVAGQNSGASCLNYLVTARQAGEQRHFSFGNMQYEVTHIEHQIDTIVGVDDYLASTWLTFIIPLKKNLGTIGSIDIPIPLRAYPTPPSITRQASDYPSGQDDSDTSTIAEARQWNYTYNYARAGASQDTIHTQIELNLPPTIKQDANETATNVDKVYELPERLAEFIAVYSAIQKDLIQYLSQITDSTDQSSTEYVNAQKAAAAFTKVVGWVANAWDTWNQVNRRGASSMRLKEVPETPKPITYKYTVSEFANSDGDLVIEILPNAANPDGLLPAINLINTDETYTPAPVTGKTNEWTFNDSTNKTVPYSDQDTIPERKISLEGLDIINRQNAWSGALIKRNEELLQNTDGTWETTNPSFVYQTPLVKFYNQLNPLLVCNAPINVAQIESTTNPLTSQTLDLAQQMQNLFTALVKDMEMLEINMKLEVEYSYNFVGTQSNQDPLPLTLPITLPILLATPFNLNKTTDLEIGTSGDYCTAGNEGFVCYLSQTLLQWFSAKNPNKTGGQLIFKLDLNSSFSNTPMLKLLEVTLYIANVNELKEDS